MMVRRLPRLRIPLTFVVFDVRQLDGETLIRLPYTERRAL
jgi:ATP-dependent DNA ligase